MKIKPGTVTAVISDTHIGSSLGLALPKWTIQGAKADEHQELTASLASQWIYANWLEYWEYVKFLAGVRGKHRTHRIVTIHCGDIVEGVHHERVQMLTNPQDQIDMASEILTQIANLSDGGVYATHGTPTHAGAIYGSESAVANRCGFRALEPELHLDIDGLIVWAHHHGRAGARDWTSASASVAVQARLLALEIGEPAPHYIFTGHDHRIDDSGTKLKTRAITCSSWQLKTTHGHKVASGQRSDIGGFILLPGGALDESRARYAAAPDQPKLRKV